MKIIKAQQTDLDTVKEITHTTVNTIYPHYYPDGAVKFFLEHHSDENIRDDISKGCVYLLNDAEEKSIGTVTVKNNEICRLFVLPEYQGNGFGKILLDFSEAEIAKKYDEIVLDSSLSAKPVYIKRGYKEREYRTVRTSNGDCLCYDVMTKNI